jgi:hypothetical protein
MKLSDRTMILLAIGLLLACPLALWAQWNKKPYTEWSEKDAQKLLDNSPWGQTQVFSDTSNEFGTGRRGNVTATDPNSVDYSAHHLNIRVRFLSAIPVRQAFARLITISQKGVLDKQLEERLKAFATQDFPDYIIVSVDGEAQESKSEVREFKSLLDTRTTADLKNNTYLTGKNGQRVFLAEYQSPKKDNLGAKFIFPRLVDGQPFITPDTDEIHFYSEFSSKYKLSTRYKVKDMMFQGKLEY